MDISHTASLTEYKAEYVQEARMAFAEVLNQDAGDTRKIDQLIAFVLSHEKLSAGSISGAFLKLSPAEAFALTCDLERRVTLGMMERSVVKRRSTWVKRRLDTLEALAALTGANVPNTGSTAAQHDETSARFTGYYREIYLGLIETEDTAGRESARPRVRPRWDTINVEVLPE